jgi:hypothetical protein
MTTMLDPVFAPRSLEQNDQSQDLPLNVALMLLLMTKIPELDQKADQYCQEMETTHRKMELANTLLQKLCERSSSDGKVDFTNDEEAKTLLQQIKDIGISINAEKLTYSVEEKGSLIKAIEHFISTQNIDIKLLSQKCDKCLKDRQSLYEAVSTSFKSLKDVWSRFCANIQSR